ncbi:MAG: hypothetical protein AB8F65_08825 [Woeseiaceae bacterium]
MTSISRFLLITVIVFGLAACQSDESASVADAPAVEAHSMAEAGEPVPTTKKVVTGEARDDETPIKSMETGSEHDAGALPLPKRLAFMTGHVEAGLAVYRAGEPEMAAPHLLHPVSETHAAERAGLDQLGFDGELFVRLSAALESGVPAAAIEPQLNAAQENLAGVAERAGGNTLDIVRFLMDTVVEEYSIGVTNGVVTDIGEYQDAYGFTKVAIQRVTASDLDQRDALLISLSRLLESWGGPPIPRDTPATASTINAQVAQVLALL